MSARIEAANKHKSLGNEYHKEGNYDKAIEEYTMAHNMCPTEAVYLCNRACSYLESGKFMKCAEDCRTALDLYPDNKVLLIKLEWRMAKANFYIGYYYDCVKGLEEVEQLGGRLDAYSKSMRRVARTRRNPKWDKEPLNPLKAIPYTRPYLINLRRYHPFGSQYRPFSILRGLGPEIPPIDILTETVERKDQTLLPLLFYADGNARHALRTYIDIDRQVEYYTERSSYQRGNVRFECHIADVKREGLARIVLIHVLLLNVGRYRWEDMMERQRNDNNRAYQAMRLLYHVYHGILLPSSLLPALKIILKRLIYLALQGDMWVKDPLTRYILCTKELKYLLVDVWTYWVVQDTPTEAFLSEHVDHFDEFMTETFFYRAEEDVRDIYDIFPSYQREIDYLQATCVLKTATNIYELDTETYVVNPSVLDLDLTAIVPNLHIFEAPTIPVLTLLHDEHDADCARDAYGQRTSFPSSKNTMFYDASRFLWEAGVALHRLTSHMPFPSLSVVLQIGELGLVCEALRETNFRRVDVGTNYHRYGLLETILQVGTSISKGGDAGMICYPIRKDEMKTPDYFEVYMFLSMRVTSPEELEKLMGVRLVTPYDRVYNGMAFAHTAGSHPVKYHRLAPKSLFITWLYEVFLTCLELPTPNNHSIIMHSSNLGLFFRLIPYLQEYGYPMQWVNELLEMILNVEVEVEERELPEKLKEYGTICSKELAIKGIHCHRKEIEALCSLYTYHFPLGIQYPLDPPSQILPVYIRVKFDRNIIHQSLIHYRALKVVICLNQKAVKRLKNHFRLDDISVAEASQDYLCFSCIDWQRGRSQVTIYAYRDYIEQIRRHAHVLLVQTISNAILSEPSPMDTFSSLHPFGLVDPSDTTMDLEIDSGLSFGKVPVHLPRPYSSPYHESVPGFLDAIKAAHK